MDTLPEIMLNLGLPLLGLAAFGFVCWLLDFPPGIRTKGHVHSPSSEPTKQRVYTCAAKGCRRRATRVFITTHEIQMLCADHEGGHPTVSMAEYRQRFDDQ